MIAVLAWLKLHWRPFAVVVALVLAFGAGRFATPTKVVTKTEVQTVVKTEIKTVEVEKRVEVQAKAQIVYVDRVITKEGTITEHIVTKTAETNTTTDRKAEKVDDKALTATTVKTEKTVTNDAPRLTVNILAGVDLKPAWQPIPGAGPLALGVSVTYRIAGPLTVGAWGVHTGAFGVSVGAQF